NRGHQNQWKLTIYCNPDSVPAQFLKFKEFSNFVAEVFQLTAKLFNSTQPAPRDQIERLYSQFEESEYLESVLEALRDRIVQHFSKTNSHFEVFVKNPSFLQFFLVTDGRSPENQKHWLRYFPLRDQREILGDLNRKIPANPDMVKKIRENLESKCLPLPQDFSSFITKDYRWNSERAFVGYSYDTATSLYLRDWQKEPRARGIHLSEKEKHERNIATTIMQSLRGDTPHQFIFPLFSKKQAIGVVAINCPEDVERSARIVPIRSARDLGFLISLALQTDDLVNHIQKEKRKMAQVQSYKHVTQSILHGEGSYCMELQAFLETLENTGSVKANPSLAPFVDRISYMIRDKKNILEEFMATKDPIREVLKQYLYPTLQGVPPKHADIPIGILLGMDKHLYNLFCRDGHLELNLNPGPCLKANGKIVNLNYYVLARIVANLIRNSNRVANERNLEQRKLCIIMEILQQESRNCLQIIAEDNCGGFDDDEMPRDITFDTWSAYLNTTESPRGMGFFMFARYATASQGHCHISNILEPEKGARVEILLSLHSPVAGE
ncbi:MAG: ATP-binding protein, partial [Gammaproteobacteria bacterium]